MTRGIDKEKVVDEHGYNKTHLSVQMGLDRHWLHRDRFAHWLRWQHVTKEVKRKEDRVLDLACGDGSLALALYANMMGPAAYHGYEYRKTMVEKNTKNITPNFECVFKQTDLCQDGWVAAAQEFAPTVITNFEFIEHIPEDQVAPFLNRVKQVMSANTVFYLSTPCFDGKTMSKNHVKEWYFDELRDLIMSLGFVVDDVFGTFISKSDCERAIIANSRADALMEIYNRLADYYHTAALSVMLAPLFPGYARNAIWRLRK